MRLASQFVAKIPVAALAGVLLATTVQMVEVGSLKAMVRATRGDAAVLFLTFAVTVVFDLVAAVVVGLGLAILIALRSVARNAKVEMVPLEPGDHSTAEHALLKERIVAFRIDGPLFFGAAHRFLLELTEVSDVEVVILRMSRVSTLDATGASVLGDVITRLEQRHIKVMLSGISEAHDDVLSALGVAQHLQREGLVFADTPSAIRFAREGLLSDAHG